MKKRMKTTMETIAMKANSVSMRVRKVLYSAGLALTTSTLTVNMALAAKSNNDPSDQISAGVKKMCLQIFNIISAVVGPIACVALAAVAITIIWGNQQSTEKAKSFAVRLVIGCAIVFLAPLIILQITGWFNTGNNGGLFD